MIIMKDLYINDMIQWVRITVKTERGLWSGLVDGIEGL
jgi:hypothetical protein